MWDSLIVMGKDVGWHVMDMGTGFWIWILDMGVGTSSGIWVLALGVGCRLCFRAMFT